MRLLKTVMLTLFSLIFPLGPLCTTQNPEASIVVDPNARILKIGESTSGSLTPNDSDLKGFFYDRYQLLLDKESPVTLSLESYCFDALLFLLDESGNKIASDDNSGTGTNARLSVTVEKDGIYELIITTEDLNGQGLYELKIESGNDSRITDTGVALSRDIEYFEKAIQVALKNKKFKRTATLYSKLALLLHEKGFYAKASQNWTKAIKYAREGQAMHVLMKALGGQGFTYLFLERNDDAIKSFNKAVLIAEQRNNLSDLALVYKFIADSFTQFDKYEDAVNLYQKSIALRQQIQDFTGEQDAWESLANTYTLMDETANAKYAYGQALDISKVRRDYIGEARIMANFGLLYHNQGEYRQAAKLYLNSIALSQATGDLSQEAETAINLGLLYTSLAAYPDALNIIGSAMRSEN